MNKLSILDIKKYALENNVPIIQDEALNYILELIKKNNYKNILEIGSAIGYSSICMAQAGTSVQTIEKDIVRYTKAVHNIKELNVDVKIYLLDAIEFETEDKFDLIFIDAAKGQYRKYFEKFSANLKDNGVIVCDNLNFHHLKIEEVSKRTASLLKKIQQFKSFLEENKDFVTDFINVGDGLSISRKKV